MGGRGVWRLGAPNLSDFALGVKTAAWRFAFFLSSFLSSSNLLLGRDLPLLYPGASRGGRGNPTCSGWGAPFRHQQL